MSIVQVACKFYGCRRPGCGEYNWVLTVMLRRGAGGSGIEHTALSSGGLKRPTKSRYAKLVHYCCALVDCRTVAAESDCASQGRRRER